jgi:hypothetical protein
MMKFEKQVYCCNVRFLLVMNSLFLEPFFILLVFIHRGYDFYIFSLVFWAKRNDRFRVFATFCFCTEIMEEHSNMIFMCL